MTTINTKSSLFYGQAAGFCYNAKKMITAFSERTRASSGDSTQLLYLRARQYSPNTGRFLTRDIWGGDPNLPTTYNKWMYVNGNPTNYNDPTGYSPSCAIKGTCGPNVTEWLRKEIANHYGYGIEIKNKVRRMKDRAATITAISPCPDIFALLSLVAIEPPFNQIVREFKFPKTNIPIAITPLLSPYNANIIIDILGRVEYALYGLAVDYTNLDYITNSALCNTGGCGSVLKGINSHPVVSLCGQCRDASDFGNMIFGVGGAGRGYSSTFVLASALLYNKMSGDSTSGLIDGAGAIPGWAIGYGGYYNDINMLCQIANTKRVGRDSVEQIRGCQACNGVAFNVGTIPSSILRVSRSGGPNGEATTIEELENKLDGGLDKLFIQLLRQSIIIF